MHMEVIGADQLHDCGKRDHSAPWHALPLIPAFLHGQVGKLCLMWPWKVGTLFLEIYSSTQVLKLKT